MTARAGGKPSAAAGGAEAIDAVASDACDASGLVAYFGYGSLVNRRTLRTDVVAAWPARLRGWRRLWRGRAGTPADRQGPLGRPFSLLSVAPAGDAAIDGLLVVDRAENLAAVDAREFRYARRPVDADALDTFGVRLPACRLYVYEALDGEASESPPILRSYLDAVLQGFLVEHGEAGLRRFVEETDGFERPVHEDRAAPLYPRAVTLTARERALFDAVLADRAARRTGA